MLHNDMTPEEQLLDRLQGIAAQHGSVCLITTVPPTAGTLPWSICLQGRAWGHARSLDDALTDACHALSMLPSEADAIRMEIAKQQELLAALEGKS